MPEGNKQELTKEALVERFAKLQGLPKYRAEEAFDSLFELLARAVWKGGRLHVPKFGVFYVAKTRARTVLHDGREYLIPKGRRIRFKPAKALLERAASPRAPTIRRTIEISS
jgi:nucleoid DNA-binding protein